MTIFDVMEEVTQRREQKTELGEERISGLIAGVVMENYDKDMPGKVCVKIPVRDEEKDTLKWVPVSSPYYGSEWGQFFLPEKGDQVLLAFEGGSIDKPYVIGSISRDSGKFQKSSADEQNQKKRITTKHGSELVFTDHKEGDGEKDCIELHTAGKSHALTLDNEKKVIVLEDKEKNCRLEMKTENGNIEIKAAKKLTIQVGDAIKISMNGDSGAISIEAQKISVQAGKMLECKTDGTAKISGQQAIIEASSILKAESNGMVTIAGGPIKIG